MIEVELPDGTIAEFPAGTSQDVIKGALQKRFKQPLTSSELAKGYAGKAAQGATFGFADELVGLGDEQAKEQYRALMDRMEAERPYSSLAAEIGGAVAMPMGAAKMGGQAIKRGMQGVANYASKGLPQAFGTSAGVGSLSGGLYATGTGEGTLRERLPDAATGAGLGGLFGIGGVAVTRGAPALAKRMAAIIGKRKQPVPQRTFTEIAEGMDAPKQLEGDVQSGALQKVSKAAKQDAPEALEAWKSEPEKALVEMYGTKSRQLAKGAAQYAGGQEVAEQYFRKKISQAPEKLKQSISKNISSQDAYYAQADDILEAGRKMAKPLYDIAYKKTVTSNAVTQMPEVTTALDKAYKQFPSELKGVSRGSIKALDYAKRILDDDISKAMRAGENNLARSRTNVKNALLETMDSASPDYKKARAASGDYLSLTRAMDDGKNFMKQDPEVLQKTYKSLGENEKIAFKSGVSKQLRDLIDKTPEGQNVFNRIFGRPEQQKRLASILSPQQYKNLAEDARAQDRLFKLRNEVLGGSPTTSKAVAAGEVAAISADIATQVPTATTAVAGGLRKIFDGLNDKRAKDIAEILFEERPAEKLRLYQSMARQKGMTNAERQLSKEAYFTIDKLIKEKDVAGASVGGVVAGSVAPERYVPQENDEIGELIRNTPEPTKSISKSMVDKIINVESGGNPSSKNPQSSATGLGQFINSTWLDMINKNAPELAEGKTRSEILELRKDPEISRRMTEAYAKENQQRLERAGVTSTEGNLYLAHFLGAGQAIKVLKAASDKPVERIVSQGAVNANKSILKGKTAGEVIRWAEGKMS